MRLHLVGGFLGSGKTTAIAGAARHLVAAGLRVGIVTNDQGKYLVDTAFLDAVAAPTVEVTGGCFCCNYDDLDARLRQLDREQHPDVIFAESVGSCADLVATVIKPLRQLSTPAASFTVFADSRLLLRRLAGDPLPFHEDVIYIFDQQITEAGLLVANKIDLLTGDERARLADLAARLAVPAVRYQDSLNAEDIAAWLGQIESGAVPAPLTALDIDYVRYGAGEAALAWHDQQFTLAGADAVPALRAGLDRLLAALNRAGLPVGHIKLLIEVGDAVYKISLTGGDEAVPSVDLPAAAALRVTLNARVGADADHLRDLVASAFESAARDHGAAWAVEVVSSFHPAFPTPTHRF